MKRNAHLVDAVKPPGLKLAYEVITTDEEAALIALMQASGLAYNDYDAGNPRSTRTYGWEIEYPSFIISPRPPMPEGLRAIRDLAADFAGVNPDALVNCLLNRYEPASIIQAHIDQPMWDHVIGISLGSAATMRFAKPSVRADDPIDVVLEPRSIYLMSGDARHLYSHSLPAVEATRYSITFRTFSDKGRNASERQLAPS